MAQERPKVGHEWGNRSGTWYCRVCLAASRAVHPPRTRCPSMAQSMAKVVTESQGHNVLVAPRTDGTGIVLMCSRCGHYAATARPTNLHKKARQGGVESQGAEHSYLRFARGVHPRYAEGPAKVLEPAFPASWLVAREPPKDTEAPT